MSKSQHREPAVSAGGGLAQDTTIPVAASAGVGLAQDSTVPPARGRLSSRGNRRGVRGSRRGGSSSGGHISTEIRRDGSDVVMDSNPNSSAAVEEVADPD